MVSKSPTHYPCDLSRTFRVILLSFTLMNGNPSSVNIKQHCRRASGFQTEDVPQLHWKLERKSLHSYDPKTCLDEIEKWLKEREIDQQECLVTEVTTLEANLSTDCTSLDASSVTEGAALEACLVTKGIAMDANLVAKESTYDSITSPEQLDKSSSSGNDADVERYSLIRLILTLKKLILDLHMIVTQCLTLRKAGQTDQTLRMLIPKEDNVNTRKQGLGFDNKNDVENSSLLNKAKALAPCLYNIDEMGKELLSDHKIISEEE
ncbi:hypothetical protein Tco_1136099 [Tanacetum coccineum]